MNQQDADIAIVGAGLVGLFAAIALRKAGYSVVLVDSQDQVQPDLSQKNLDQRIYAISPSNANWLASLGAWQLLDFECLGKIVAMDIWENPKRTHLSLLASDVNEDYLGFVVEENRLKHALSKCVEELDICMLLGVPCQSLEVDENQSLMTLANGQVIKSQLLLAADGSNSWVRQQLGIVVKQKSYDQIAVVANFEIEKSHANVARQWFLYDIVGGGSVLAWLPLPDHKISIVWSVPTSYADELLQLSPIDFSQRVMEAGNHLLGELSLIGQPATFPLILKTSSILTQGSALLVGDAAHSIHPMAGQGVNLGFRDVIDLLSTLSTKNPYQTLNDAHLLKRYERIRKADMLNMLVITDGLYSLFENDHAIVRKIRSWGFEISQSPLVKKRLVTNALAL